MKKQSTVWKGKYLTSKRGYERLRGAVEIIHIMEPILDDFIEFAELPAFQELKKKKWDEKEARSRAEAEESSNEMKDEIMKKEKGLGRRSEKETDY